MKISDYLYSYRIRPSQMQRDNKYEEFANDHSRIVFCSSFRRMMQKAQVFSLETNSSVRNRLTHSIEVEDIGKTIARKVGFRLLEEGKATIEDVICLETVTANACLIHDIGNPPFGHFGEDAIKHWCMKHALEIARTKNELKNIDSDSPCFCDLYNFDGNPQGFRIVTKLHADLDNHGLNLTASTLLASIKYPCASVAEQKEFGHKKLGIFSSEADAYHKICQRTGQKTGKRYFLSYLMELADDICYCLNDIADAFEKRVIDATFFKEEFRKIAEENKIAPALLEGIFPAQPISNYAHEVSIKVSRKCINSATDYFTNNIDAYIAGEKGELIKDIPEGALLECFKIFARKHIYTLHEVQRLEIAGHKVVSGLLEHYGELLKVSREDFTYFIENRQASKGKNLDIEWRIFNQLSRRMIKSYSYNTADTDELEWFCRLRLIVDYVSGMTDHSALKIYQNSMGISL